MANSIERLVIQAIRTFSREKPVSPQAFQSNFSLLKSIADKITAEDVNLHESLTRYSGISASSQQEAPVTYIEIFENQDVTIGIFVLKPNTRIPLHDHPSMYGILRVILGAVHVQSYTALPSTKYRTPECLKHSIAGSGGLLFAESLKRQAIVIANKVPDALCSPSDGACVLTPSERNLHEIRCVDGPSAFLDVLAPPYISDSSDDVARVCHYYTEAPKPPIATTQDEKLKKDTNHKWLLQIPSPKEFFCDSAPYCGPEINVVS